MKIEIKKLLVIFIVGFIVCLNIEVCYQGIMGVFQGDFSFSGTTSIYKGILGGLILIVLGKLNEIGLKYPLFIHCLIGMVIITALELFLGILLNLFFNFSIGDYSNLLYDWLATITQGQISCSFAVIWFFLSPFAFWLDDQIRWIFYKTGHCKHMGHNYSLVWLYKKLFSLKKIEFRR